MPKHLQTNIYKNNLLLLVVVELSVISDDLYHFQFVGQLSLNVLSQVRTIQQKNDDIFHILRNVLTLHGTERNKNLKGKSVKKIYRMIVYPVGIYLLKVNNRNSRKRCEICSKLTIKTPERRHWRLQFLNCSVYFRKLKY